MIHVIVNGVADYCKSHTSASGLKLKLMMDDCRSSDQLVPRSPGCSSDVWCWPESPCSMELAGAEIFQHGSCDIFEAQTFNM